MASKFNGKLNYWFDGVHTTELGSKAIVEVVIEDLISSGKSSLEAVKALRKEGLNVKGLISIFTYGFDTAAKNFKKANCEFISLCNYSTLLQVAEKQDYIKQSDLEVLEKWRKNPSKWKK